MLDRVAVVYTVDLGRLDQQIGLDLDRTQAGRGIGSEIGAAGAGREYQDLVARDPPPGVTLRVTIANLGHVEPGHDRRPDTALADSVL